MKYKFFFVGSNTAGTSFKSKLCNCIAIAVVQIVSSSKITRNKYVNLFMPELIMQQ